MAYYKCGKIFATQNSNTSIETASGAIANFNTSLAMPVLDCIAEFSATQDLHGQSAPYPAGGGKNLFNVVAGTKPNIDLTLNSDGSVKLNGTATTSYNFSNTYNLKAGTYTLSCPFSGTLPSTAARVQIYNADYSLSVSITNPDPSNTKVTFTTTDDMTVQCRIRVEGGFNYNNVILYPQLEVGETATSYAPYSNICPIVGVDKVNVTCCGKNLFSYDLTIRNGYWDANGFVGTNAIVPKESAVSWQYIRVYVEGLSSITLSGFDNQGGTNCAWLSSENVNDVISRFNSSNKNGTKIVPSGAKYLCLTIFNIKDKLNTYPNVQIELGNQATTFEAYNGTTVLINLGGTYYGGSVDAVTGKITLTYQVVDLQTLSWLYDNASKRWQATVSGIKQSSTRSGDILAEQWEVDTSAVAGDEYKIFTYDKYLFCYTTDNVNSPEGLCTYPLATPIEVQASNTAELLTKAGVNNIYCDTGNIEVKYRRINNDL